MLAFLHIIRGLKDVLFSQENYGAALYCGATVF